MNQWYRYYRRLADRTRNYHHNKAVSAFCYQNLAPLAPNRESQVLLDKFMTEEKAHAFALGRLYQQLTGKPVPSCSIPPVAFASYPEGLRQRLWAESTAFLQYSEEFLSAPDHYLRRLFYRLGAVAVQHALCLSAFHPPEGTAPKG
ncbi:MAG: ferritin-like domain-containing protein [Firmicutes bacterium]|nr:ferritin-like domain-containing protein [Bacillota bacterium]